MDRCDVLVAGGGPAGSTCARVLVAAGLDVVVLDRATFPRPKVCAGWITPQVLAELGVDPEQYSRGLVLQPIRGFRTGFLGSELLETRYHQVVSYGILRSQFDHFLLARSGARLRTGEALASLEHGSGGWEVNGELRAPILVGAGGHFCPVARRLGEGPRDGVVVAAQEVEFELDGTGREACRVEGETPELYFCKDLRGYGWCFRKGHHLNVGLGREGGGPLPARFRAFLEDLVRRERVPRQLLSARPRGHAYRLWGRGPRRLAGEGFLLVGDAAGLAYPQSGEGIRPAVESGLLAAQAILAARGDPRGEALAAYPAALARRLGPPARDGGKDPGPLHRRAARYLLASRWLTRRVVLGRWFLRSGDAPLTAPPWP